MDLPYARVFFCAVLSNQCARLRSVKIARRKNPGKLP